MSGDVVVPRAGLRAFRTLYRTFVTLALRGTSALAQGRGVGATRPFTTVYLSAALLGIFLAVPVAFLPPAAGALAYCTGVLLWSNLAVVADFGTVVLAPEDDDIVFPLPVGSRAYLAARLAVAARHVVLLAACVGACGALVAGFRAGSPLPALGMALGAVQAGLFALVLGFAVYRVALTVLGGERLRGLLAYAPGILGMVFAFLPQALPAMRAPGWVLHVGEHPAAWAFPPFWFSALHDASLADAPSAWARVGVGVAALGAAALVLVGALGRGTLERLSRLSAAGDAGPRRRGPVGAVGPGRLARTLFGVRSAPARAGWLFARAVMRSRSFRSRAFPMLVAPVVWLVFVGLRSDATGTSETMQPVVTLMLALMGSGVIAILPYAEPPDGAWLYEAFPFERYGRFHLGVLRAAIATWNVPMWVVFGGVLLAADPSPGTVLRLVYGVGVSVVVAALVAAGTRERPPFSERYRTGRSEGRVGANLVAMLVAMGSTVLDVVVSRVYPHGRVLLAGGAVAAAAYQLSSLAYVLDRVPPPALRPARTGA